MKSLSEMLDTAIVGMVMRRLPTLAQAINRVGVEIINKPEIKAAAFTNGKAIYLNECIIKEMDEKGTETVNGKTYHYKFDEKILTFILCHELMHLLNNTVERGNAIGILYDDTSEEGMKKHELWNIATDFEINSLLYNNKSDGKPRPIGNKPDWCCYDDKYIDVPAEEIYLELLQKAKQNSQNNGGKGKWSFSAGDMQYSVSGDQGDNDSQSNGGNNGDNEGDGDNQDNKQSNGLSYGLDVHMPFVDELTKSEVRAKLSDALNNGKEAGTGMSAFDRALEIAFKPQPFNWRRALTRYIKSMMKENYTWNKPSRAGIANGLILPSTSTTPKLHVGVAVDTSGSIGDKELRLLMNHIFTILSQFKQFAVDVWCCSTEVHEDTFKTYTAANKSKLDEFRIESDGGTDMSKNLAFVEKKYKGNKPDLLMIFTDGFDNLSGDETIRTNYPVVWLIVDNKEFVKPKHMPGAVYEFDTSAE